MITNVLPLFMVHSVYRGSDECYVVTKSCGRESDKSLAYVIRSNSEALAYIAAVINSSCLIVVVGLIVVVVVVTV